jgi:hypothetical protein
LTIFLDLPDASHPAGSEFWRAATGYGPSQSRGVLGEFAILVPPDGDAHLRTHDTGGDAGPDPASTP